MLCLGFPDDRGEIAAISLQIRATIFLGPNRGRGCDREEKRTMAETREPHGEAVGALWAHIEKGGGVSISPPIKNALCAIGRFATS